jgi:endonuclease-3
MTARSRRPAARQPAEAADEMRRRARTVVRRLTKTYPDAKCSLAFRNPLELVVATILSAQCTDDRVNMVTPALFRRYPTVEAFAQARLGDIEELIRSTGFYRNKAKSIIGMATSVVDQHDGAIPRDMDALVALTGVGRKTANVVLGNAFGIAAGVVVDTHVGRITRLLRFTSEKDPVKVERDLIDIVPKRSWILFPHLMIQHGRAVCIARRPRCTECVLADLCPSAQLA